MKVRPALAALLALAACADPQPPAGAVPTAVAPTSDQAAATLVETYYALLSQKDFDAANRLWGSAAADDAAFKAQFGDVAEIRAEVGKPGPSEGACGSVYIEVPVRVRSRLAGGVARSQTGEITLRRVNNVDGATPAQLRWHIASVALTPG